VNERSEAIRNTLFSSVGIYTEYLLGMVVSILIARHLGPSDFGTYSLVVWLIACGVTVTNAGTTTTMIKFVAELRGSQNEELLASLMGYLRRAQSLFLLALLAVGGTVFLLSADTLAPGFNRYAMCGLLVFCVVLRSNYMLNIAVAKGFERFGATATIALYAAPVNLVLVAAAELLHGPVEAFLAVFAISSVVFYVASLVQVRRFAPREPRRAVLPPELMRRIHRHMVFAAIISSVNFFTASETEVLFLNLLATPADAGDFKVAYQLASGASLLLPGVFSAILLPLMAKALSEGRPVAARRFSASTVYLTMLAAPLVGFGVLFADDAIAVLYGPAYAAASIVLTGCLFAYSASVISSAASSLLMSADHQHSVLARVVGCGALKVVLDIVLIRYFGLVGATLAFVVAAVLGAAITVGLALRVGHATLPWTRLVRIIAAIAVAVALVFPARALHPPLLAAAGGGILLTLIYVVLTLAFGCWTAADLAYLQEMHGRFARGRPRFVAYALARARDRAGRD
jgi:O-antigen/teichoic acid export membrane protein